MFQGGARGLLESPLARLALTSARHADNKASENHTHLCTPTQATLAVISETRGATSCRSEQSEGLWDRS
jgi:hypothetical protein